MEPEETQEVVQRIVANNIPTPSPAKRHRTTERVEAAITNKNSSADALSNVPFYWQRHAKNKRVRGQKKKKKIQSKWSFET